MTVSASHLYFPEAEVLRNRSSLKQILRNNSQKQSSQKQKFSETEVPRNTNSQKQKKKLFWHTLEIFCMPWRKKRKFSLMYLSTCSFYCYDSMAAVLSKSNHSSLTCLLACSLHLASSLEASSSVLICTSLGGLIFPVRILRNKPWKTRNNHKVFGIYKINQCMNCFYERKATT